MNELKLLSEHLCHSGVQRHYEHVSVEIGLTMRFSVFLPGQCALSSVPGLLFLAGLTCSEETFPIKAGAQELASQLGLALICPDTSPRGAGVPGESSAWDFGVGAGFYLDAEREPWARSWRMESYLIKELLPLVTSRLPIDSQRLGISGHSMGGHGALILALRNPGIFRSVSALAPICSPSQVPWGVKAFSGYLGDDVSAWKRHDASFLMQAQPRAPWPEGLLIDQGTMDKFLIEQLKPGILEQACNGVGQPLDLRMHDGFDHGYFFIQTFINAHLRHHHHILERLRDQGFASTGRADLEAEMTVAT